MATIGENIKKARNKLGLTQDDFYSDPKYRATILKRENGECFYCLKKISEGDYVLDHLTS